MGMRLLAPGQWSACGSNGAGDCLVFEVADAERGDLIVSDTDRTFRAKIQGHEVAQFVAAYLGAQVPADVMGVIAADCKRYETEVGSDVASIAATLAEQAASR